MSLLLGLGHRSVAYISLNHHAGWSQERLRQFADNPKAGAAQVFELMASVVKTPLGDVASNFLKTLIDNGRLEALPEVAAQFTVLKNARDGVADALVESAFEIDSAALAKNPLGDPARRDRKSVV